MTMAILMNVQNPMTAMMMMMKKQAPWDLLTSGSAYHMVLVLRMEYPVLALCSLLRMPRHVIARQYGVPALPTCLPTYC